MKSDESYRTVAIPRTLRKRLEGEYRRRNPHGSDYLMIRPDGTLRDPHKDSKLFHAFLKKQDIKVVRYHDLRHTYGSVLMTEGMDGISIGKLMGQWIPGVTSRYLHLSPEMRKKAANLLEKAFSPEQVKNAS